MKKYKIWSVFIIALCIIATGCSRDDVDTNDTPKNDTQNNSVNINQSTDKKDAKEDLDNSEDIESKEVTKTQYKDLLLKNHEKYIKPLNLRKYTNIKEVQASKGITDNRELVSNIKDNINDNRNNLMSFEQSMQELSIKDIETKEINDKLVDECKIYLEDLDKTEEYLDILDEEVLQKTNSEFVSHIEGIINSEKLDRSKFDEIIGEIEKSLDVQINDDTQTQ